MSEEFIITGKYKSENYRVWRNEYKEYKYSIYSWNSQFFSKQSFKTKEQAIADIKNRINKQDWL